MTGSCSWRCCWFLTWRSGSMVMSHHESWIILCPNPFLTEPTHCDICSTACLFSLTWTLSHSCYLCLARRSLSRAVPSFTFAGRKARGKLSMQIFFAKFCFRTFALESLYCCCSLDLFRHVFYLHCMTLFLLAFRSSFSLSCELRGYRTAKGAIRGAAGGRGFMDP